MRLGVIGAGRWGRNIIRTLRHMSGVQVSCVASRNPAVRDLVDAACMLENDWRNLIRRRDIDAVVVATPPAAHAEITREAVSAGMAVFVEKPLTCNIEEAERLLDFVSRTNGYVLVDHVHMFSHAYQALKARRPTIGSIRRIQTEAGAWGPFRANTPVLWDWGPHDAAFCLDLLGTLPLCLAADRVMRRPIGNAWGETLALHAVYPDSVTASIRLSNVMRRKCRSLLVEGAKGVLIFDDRAEHKVVYRPAGPIDVPPEIIAISSEPALDCALSRFVENISTGHMSLEDLRFGVDVVRMLASWEKTLH